MSGDWCAAGVAVDHLPAREFAEQDRRGSARRAGECRKNPPGAPLATGRRWICRRLRQRRWSTGGTPAVRRAAMRCPSWGEYKVGRPGARLGIIGANPPFLLTVKTRRGECRKIRRASARSSKRAISGLESGSARSGAIVAWRRRRSRQPLQRGYRHRLLVAGTDPESLG